MSDLEERKSLKSFKVTTVNLVMVIIAALLFAVLIFETVSVHKCYKESRDATREYFRCQQDAYRVSDGSDLLTEKVLMFVEMEDPVFAKEYFEEIEVSRSRDTALEDLLKTYSDEYIEQEMKAAMNSSNELVDVEVHAIRLTYEAMGAPESEMPGKVAQFELPEDEKALSAEEKRDKARKMVLGMDYHLVKLDIDGHLQNVIEAILEAAQQDMVRHENDLSSNLTLQRVFISLLFIMNVVIFAYIMTIIVRPLKVYVKNIKEDGFIDVVGSYEFKYLALTYNNIYELDAKQETASRYADEHDQLTGVMNRNAFEKISSLYKDSATPVAVLYIDIDFFKKVNEIYGHERGDALLRKVAKMLQKYFRAGDMVIRLGGDEFAVLLTDITTEQIGKIRGKIDAMNELLQNPEDGLPPVSLSVGGAFSETGYSEELTARAVKALLRVKDAGRASCRFAEEDGE